jgi:acyl-CoA thioesterase
MEKADIVNFMMQNDFFSQWLGIEILEQAEGRCRLRMVIKKEMLNGFGIAHGGITYSLADSALAFASNSKGLKSVSIETSISHIGSLSENDTVIASAECITETAKLGHYQVIISPEGSPEKIIALFRGIVYKKAENW